MFDVLIIGAGVTGAFVARKLSKYQLDVLLLDKENDVGNVTSNANSAIIHSGYDPVPGTLKAKLNVAGNAMYDKIAEELDVHFFRIGSITVATSEKQMETLNDLLIRSKENGVETRILNQKELRELEPNVSPNALGGLLAPTAGIIDPFNLVVHCVENAVDNGVKLRLDEEVVDIKYLKDHFVVKTTKSEYESKVVVNAAGLGSEIIARMVEDVDWKLTPRKGEYFVLDHYDNNLVYHTIFPLPSEKGKGVLVSPTSSYNYLVGPSSELVDDIDDFSTDSPTLANIRAQATDLIPGIPFNQVIRVFSGIRPTSTRHDFILEPAKSNPYFINAAGIESPGLVSAPAVAEYLFDNYLSKVLDLKEKKDYNPYVKKYAKLNELDNETRNKLIKENPNYGKIVCSCEKVSLGEIEDLFKRSVPPTTVKGVKRRVRAGFGKCQGGFCSSVVTLALAKHYGLNPTEINWDRDNGEILLEEVKR